MGDRRRRRERHKRHKARATAECRKLRAQLLNERAAWWHSVSPLLDRSVFVLEKEVRNELVPPHPCVRHTFRAVRYSVTRAGARKLETYAADACISSDAAKYGAVDIGRSAKERAAQEMGMALFMGWPK